jgi:hypothetical protein
MMMILLKLFLEVEFLAMRSQVLYGLIGSCGEGDKRLWAREAGWTKD